MARTRCRSFKIISTSISSSSPPSPSSSHPPQKYRTRYFLMLLVLSTFSGTTTRRRTEALVVSPSLCPSLTSLVRRTKTRAGTATTAAFVSKQRQFAQPAFGQAAFANGLKKKRKDQNKKKNGNGRDGDTEGSSVRTERYGSDSVIGSKHLERIRTAGRVGTKRFVDPCKVFVGNLPYDVDEGDVRGWLCERMGVPHAVLIHHLNVVRDWKTNQSKGYAFVVFTESIYATVCIDKCNGAAFRGRPLTVKQGKKKLPDGQLYVKKKGDRKDELSPEELAIEAGLDEAAGGSVAATEKRNQKKNKKAAKKTGSVLEAMDPLNVALFRKLDPDLLEGYDDDDERGEEIGIDDPDDGKDDDTDEDIGYGNVDDDDDGDYDELWLDGDDGDIMILSDDDEDTIEQDFDGRSDDDGDEGEEDDSPTAMNRRQRREAARRRKRRKLPHTGFDPATKTAQTPSSSSST